MMRLLLVGVLLALSGCGGGGTTGTNYSEAPPMAEIVGTPTPKTTPTPEPAEAIENAVDNATVTENAATVDDASVNVAE
jgi:hypothetical protein